MGLIVRHWADEAADEAVVVENGCSCAAPLHPHQEAIVRSCWSMSPPAGAADSRDEALHTSPPSQLIYITPTSRAHPSASLLFHRHPDLFCLFEEVHTRAQQVWMSVKKLRKEKGKARMTSNHAVHNGGSSQFGHPVIPDDAGKDCSTARAFSTKMLRTVFV
ncbi:hypothetical protein MHYP_G00020600 [Metynnis hypsauchen]